MKEPKVRFKGFEGEWEEKKFTEIVNRVSQTEKAGSLPGVEFEDIVSGRGILNKNINEKPCNKIGKMFFAGDVLFGKLRPYLRNILLPNFDGVAIGDFWVLHPNGIEPKLLYEIVNTDKFMEVANVSSGSKMPRADWNFVSEAIVIIPTDKTEQRRIASYFTHLDTLIEASRQKVEKLKQVKAASLQSFFPTHGQRTPKIRFKGCEGEWKVVKIGEVCFNKVSIFSESSLGVDCGKYPIYGATGYIQNIQSYDMKEPYVAIIKDGSGVGRVQLYPAYSSVLGTMQYLLPKENVDVSFLYSLFETIDFSEYKKGSSIPHIYFKDYACREVFFPPTLQEQRKIASYFTHLDALLTLERQRYAKLQQVKRASLTQMFA